MYGRYKKRVTCKSTLIHETALCGSGYWSGNAFYSMVLSIVSHKCTRMRRCKINQTKTTQEFLVRASKTKKSIRLIINFVDDDVVRRSSLVVPNSRIRRNSDIFIPETGDHLCVCHNWLSNWEFRHETGAHTDSIAIIALAQENDVYACTINVINNM